MNQNALLALAAIVLTAAPVLADGLDEANPELTQLLSGAKSAASAVKSDIATLDLLSGGSQTQGTVFNLYQHDIATLRGVAEKLEALKGQGSRPQQTAVERIVPIMQVFASAAGTALNAANTPKQSGSPDWSEYFKLNSDLSGELASLISAWADYARTRDGLDALARQRR